MVGPPLQVEVTKVPGGRTAVCLYNDWIDKKKGLSQTIRKEFDPEDERDLLAESGGLAGAEGPVDADGQVEYEISVLTSDKMGAGTDAKVYVELQVGACGSLIVACSVTCQV